MLRHECVCVCASFNSVQICFAVVHFSTCVKSPFTVSHSYFVSWRVNHSRSCTLNFAYVYGVFNRDTVQAIFVVTTDSVCGVVKKQREMQRCVSCELHACAILLCLKNQHFFVFVQNLSKLTKKF